MRYVDVSGVTEHADAPPQVVVAGDTLSIFIPSALLLAPAGGDLGENFSPFDIRFTALTGQDALVPSAANGAERPGFLLADRAPEGAGFLTARNSDPPVAGSAPEPFTWAMLVLGFGAVGSVLRRNPRRLSARA